MTLVRTLSLALLAAAGVIPTLVACGGNSADANSPSASASTANAPPPGGYPPNTYPPPGATTGAPNGYPPGTAGAPPPQGTAPAPSASTATLPGLPGIPVDPNLLQQIATAGAAVFGQGAAPVSLGDPVDVGIKIVAAKSITTGMQPEGALVKDTLAADAHRVEQVTLQGGKCYTFVAFSPVGQVTNVDLHLLLPPFYNMEAGHDTETDNTAVIGKGAAAICPSISAPIPYKLDIHANAGAGAVSVQIYSKDK
ncbi:hypothetical protein BH09MYX1_BH09MYX1_27880 [soil metagenome]